MTTRIVVALILGPLLFIVLFFLPPVFLAVVVAAISGIASYELLRATGSEKRTSLCVCTAVAAILIPLSFWSGREYWSVRLLAMLLMCAAFLIAIHSYDTGHPVRLTDILVCFFGGILIPVALSTLVQFKLMENGRYMVLLPVIVAFLTDAGAYFAGVFWGKHRGIIRVSPNKSLEGFVGGVVTGMVVMLLYGLLLRIFAGLDVRLPVMLVYGLVGGLVTEMGDLAFSLIKREYGVKDYGDLLPGHGGMLDRFDSMIFAAPAMWVLVVILPPLA